MFQVWSLKPERQNVTRNCGDNSKKTTNHFKSLLIRFRWKQRVHLYFHPNKNSCFQASCPRRVRSCQIKSKTNRIASKNRCISLVKESRSYSSETYLTFRVSQTISFRKVDLVRGVGTIFCPDMRCDVPVALIEPVVANQGLSTRLQKLRNDVRTALTSRWA